MMEIFSAKTLDEAKELAVQSFGISKDLIDFQILEEPKKSIFGRLKGEYKVKATYNATVETVETVETVVETPVQEPIAVPTAVDTMVTEEPSKPVETETVQQVASEVSQDVETV